MNKETGHRGFLQWAGEAFGISTQPHDPVAVNDLEPASGPALPDYADNGLAFPVFRGPYLQKDAHLAAFLFDADSKSLTALCDRALNVSSSFPYTYVPLASSVMLVFADMLVASRDARDAQVGLIPETEVGFWVPTVAMKKTAAGHVPHHLAWFIPYLFVDEGHALITGREVYGFNKLPALIQRPREIQNPEFSAQVLGFKHFDTEAVAQSERLLELSAPPTTESAQPSDLDAIRNGMAAELLKNVRTNLTGGAVEFASRFINDHIPLVFLKQFRDAQHTHQACYQSLIEAPLKVETFFKGGLFLKPYTLTIASLDSHPLVQTLGLKGREQKSTLGAWMHLDFVLENGLALKDVIHE